MSEQAQSHELGCAAGSPVSRSSSRAFTIIELLISIGIIVLLLAVLLPVVRYGLEYARGFRCQMNLRNVAFEFSLFADDGLHGSRGDDESTPGRFSLETFIESQYQVSEFWGYGKSSLAQRPADGDPLRCSEVAGRVEMRRNIPCRAGAVGPTQNISYTFNKRLYTPEGDGRRGPAPIQVWLSSSILLRPNVPLVWDLDGVEAARRDIIPHFTAPGLGSVTEMARDAYWAPALRHAGRSNTALIDGSVHASDAPLDERWDWAWQPRR